MPDITNLPTNTTLNATVNEIKNEILSITNLDTIATLTNVQNKIFNIGDLVKKADYDAKYQKWKRSILLLLIIISSRIIHLMQG